MYQSKYFLLGFVMPAKRFAGHIAAALVLFFFAATINADDLPPKLLFHVSAEKSLKADVAGGVAQPNFRDHIKRTQTGVVGPDGKPGWAIEWADNGVLSWNAPGNIYAQRGTLSFFWRARYPVTEAPFVIFRVGYADHSSWDMAWLRVDWNGKGFDAFVTDANLARTRVSFTIPENPSPETWTHIAFAWDETAGVRLYIDGKEVARKDRKGKFASADFDSGLDQLGLAGRVLSPHQVQSRYNFLRGSDFADIRIYDRMLDAAGVLDVLHQRSPQSAVAFSEAGAWLYRYGWENHKTPPLLRSATTTIRKVEFADAKDLKEWMWKGVDGIAETTWPGVYNRSRLPGRNDYFQLPDWNTYVEGGVNYDLTLPQTETVNRVEIRGAAFGELDYRKTEEEKYRRLERRPQGAVRSVYDFKELTGGQLRFSNTAQETPIQEIWAYHVSDAKEPAGSVKLHYRVRPDAKPDYDNLAELRTFIAGRYPPNERATVMALPRGAAVRKRTPEEVSANAQRMPLVHVLIPSSISYPPAGKPVTRSFAYGWENIYDGLDGIAIDIPALAIKPTSGGVIPLNIQIKDPIWPERNLMDVSVSVKPNQARTLWLDTRDRMLNGESFYITIASASPDFNATLLADAEIRLVFKARNKAKLEHVADRFNQVRDNWGFLVEEHTTSQRQKLYQRLHGDITDLLRIDPDNKLARSYWNDMSYHNQGEVPFVQPEAPDDVPLWAVLQTEELKLIRHHINWWIDNRQVSYGDFGGGISDDSDMVQQWPGLALMGVDPDKLNASITALAEAAYKNNMLTNGLGTIETDELHAYEEGININSARAIINWGDPLTMERLMETVNSLRRVVKENPQGNVLFSSNWYGGKKIYHGRNWEWQKPYSFPILHPAIMLGDFNADRRSRQLITGIADGYMAYSFIAKDGQWALPNEINWRTGETRGGEMLRGAGGGDVPTVFWSAWRWTHNDKYLKPISYVVARNGPGALARINDNVIDQLHKRDDWGKAATENAVGGSGFENFEAWQTTGDKRYLERLYAELIRQKSLDMYMNTEGHWWTDRVEAQHDLLQRARLGGVALSRGRTYPGHTVSWRFADPEGALKLGILLPNPAREKFKVVAFNMSDSDQAASMTGWNVKAGKWKMTLGIDSDGDDQADTDLKTSTVDFEKSKSVAVVFPPQKSLVITMTLVEEAKPVEMRPDIGIGQGDIQRKGNQVLVTVHSLGHEPSSASIAIVEDGDGKEVARTEVPALPAPIDLLPKTVTVNLTVPRGIDMQTAAVKIFLANGDFEVTQLNNQRKIVDK